MIDDNNRMIVVGWLKKMFDYPSLDKQDENDFRSAHLRSSTSPGKLITIITYIGERPVHVRERSGTFGNVRNHTLLLTLRSLSIHFYQVNHT